MVGPPSEEYIGWRLIYLKGGRMRISTDDIFVIVLLSLFFGGLIYLSIKSRLDEKRGKEEKNEK
jgi:hypothetical protein